MWSFNNILLMGSMYREQTCSTKNQMLTITVINSQI